MTAASYCVIPSEPAFLPKRNLIGFFCVTRRSGCDEYVGQCKTHLRMHGRNSNLFSSLWSSGSNSWRYSSARIASTPRRATLLLARPISPAARNVPPRLSETKWPAASRLCLRSSRPSARRALLRALVTRALGATLGSAAPDGWTRASRRLARRVAEFASRDQRRRLESRTRARASRIALVLSHVCLYYRSYKSALCDKH